MVNAIDNLRNLWFDAFVIDNNVAWIFAHNFNALIELNLDDYSCRFLGSVPDEEGFSHALFYNMVKYKDKLVLAPATASGVAIYSLRDKSFTIIPIDFPRTKTHSMVVYENKIYIVGNYTAKIAVLNMDDYSISMIEECERIISDKNTIDRRMVFRKNRCVVDNMLYLVSCNSNMVFRVNMKNNTVDTFEIAGINNGVRIIEQYKDHFILNEWGKASLIEWDVNEGMLDVHVCDAINDNYEYAISDLFVLEDKVIIYPTTNSNVLFWNYGDDSWVEDKRFRINEKKVMHPWNQAFPISIKVDNRIVSFCGEDLKLMIYDILTDSIERKDILNQDNIYMKLKLNIMNECERMRIDDFISVVVCK